MIGINLNGNIKYLFSSLRFFNEKEYHITRFCRDDVLLLVYDGVLRFSEDGVQYELTAGQYHIQRHDSAQAGELLSDAPKYLYVHFYAEWIDDEYALPKSGTFDYERLKTDIEKMDELSHSDAPYILKLGKFCELLTKLYEVKCNDSPASAISEYIEKEYRNKIDLVSLCKKFHFSKNHIINIFKKEYGITPITYLNLIRLKNSEYLIEATSKPIEEIAEECGYQSYSHFYRQFVRKNKISPEKFREQKRLGSI